MTIQYDDVESENIGKCQECNEENILDSTLRICFDCWCILDAKQQELEVREEEE